MFLRPPAGTTLRAMSYTSTVHCTPTHVHTLTDSHRATLSCDDCLLSLIYYRKHRQSCGQHQKLYKSIKFIITMLKNKAVAEKKEATFQGLHCKSAALKRRFGNTNLNFFYSRQCCLYEFWLQLAWPIWVRVVAKACQVTYRKEITQCRLVAVGCGWLMSRRLTLRSS